MQIDAHASAGSVTGGEVNAVKIGEVHGDVHIHAQKSVKENEIPWMAEPPPDGYVHRPNEERRVVEALLGPQKDTGGQQVGITATAALRGAGGFGKTTLARAVCQMDAVRAAFSDGVLWATLGENATEQTLQANLGLLHFELTGERTGFYNLEDAAQALGQALDGKKCLVVIDDVWRTAHLNLFARCRSGPVYLITTRMRDILSQGVVAVDVDAMQSDEALALLTDGFDSDVLTPQLQALAASLGRWPLLLRLANGQLKDSVAALGLSPEAALETIETAMQDHGLWAFDADDADAREWAVKLTVEASLKRLDVGRERFLELAVFPEDVTVPFSVVRRLWAHTANFDAFQTGRLCKRLFDMSLLLDLSGGQLRLHDVMRKYLCDTWGRERLPELHHKLVAAYQAALPAGDTMAIAWDAGADDGYYFQRLPYHLVQAGNDGEWRLLLSDFRWLRAKLDAAGVIALLGDYRLSEMDLDEKLIFGVLQLSAGVLAADKDQLSIQIIGRLGELSREYPGGALARLIRDVEEYTERPWLRPVQVRLDEPGGPLVMTLVGHYLNVYDVAITPNGRLAVSSSADGTVIVWDLANGAPLHVLEEFYMTSTSALALSTDGRLTASGDEHGKIPVWDTTSGALLHTFYGHRCWINSLKFTPDGKFLISGLEDGNLQIWDILNGELHCTLGGHSQRITATQLTPNGSTLVSASKDGTIKVWNLVDGSELLSLDGHTDCVNDIAISSDGQFVGSVSSDGTFRAWNIASGKLLHTLQHPEAANALVLTNDAQNAIVASTNNRLYVWDLASEELIHSLDGHRDRINAIALAPNEKILVSASSDKTIKVWDIIKAELLASWEGHVYDVNSIALSPDGRTVISTSDDETLKVWDLAHQGQQHVQPGHTDMVSAIALTPDGQMAISVSNDHTLKVWKLSNGIACETLTIQDCGISAVAITPDKHWMVSGSRDGRLTVWDLGTKRILYSFIRHAADVNDVAITPDGQFFLSASKDHTIGVWDLPTAAELHTLTGHLNEVTAVAISEDGRQALSTSRDSTTFRWDLTNGRLLDQWKFESKGLEVRRQLAFSGDNEGNLTVWNLEKGEAFATLEGHSSSVNDVKLAAAAPIAVSTSFDHTIRVWDWKLGKELSRFRSEVSPSCCAISADGRTILVGNYRGDVDILRLEGYLPTSHIGS